jgi:4a-hydroxytetrahydrobiopterin dehydratase
MALADQKCVPCTGGIPALDAAAIGKLQADTPAWSVIENHHLQRTFRLPDFRTALDLVNRIGAIAEEQGHHPDILLAWGKVEVTIWTHKINGLTESDFILAAKIDREAAR